MKTIAKHVLSRFGYRLTKELKGANIKDGAALFEYRTGDGQFDYERYRHVQIEGNKAKLDQVWVEEANIEFLSGYILRTIGQPASGICHGTRQGKEQSWFRKQLNCDVIGTEISDTATTFPHTIQWDFHDVKPEWRDAIDFIYSNSFDHSYAPDKCLNAWMSCVRPGGLCILEHSSGHSPEGASEMDPFGAELHLMPYFITLWGGGQYFVREILRAPKVREGLDYVAMIVIQRL